MSEGDVAVLEGFLCPICKADLGAAMKLLAHFQEEHSEDQDLLKAFKDLLGKAKKKIFTQDDFGEPRQLSPPGHLIEFQEAQEIGAVRCYKNYFDSIRNERLQRLSVPTNQLIIRLDKLLANMPTDVVKKKAYEQDIVPWLDGSAVPRCPNCTNAFHIARRQHHCRLCGSIMCNDCSSFMTISSARKILDKPREEETSNSDQSLRLCVHCITLLGKREALKESRTAKPIISQFYEKFSEYKAQADELAAMYCKMAISLNAGESIYKLSDGQVLRVKVLRLAENIDTLSGKIAVLGTKDTESPPQGQALRLQKSIRAAATSYLRNQLLSLPSLPTEQQLLQIRDRRRQVITARIHEEKLREEQKHLRHSPQHRPNSTNHDSISLGHGWVPEKKRVNKSDDPLIEQMNIIRSYIQEARSDHKYDEVASLVANLQELKREFWLQQPDQEERFEGEETSCSANQENSTK